MKISVLKEIKDNENRVGLTPEGAKALVDAGNDVFVETNAGLNSGFPNEEYEESGAKIVSKDDAWNSDMVMKVKEPLTEELQYFTEGKIVYTYFHLSGVYKELTEALIDKKTTSVAYETVEDEDGKLPLLKPMSEVSGREAVLFGANYLAKFNGGNGILISGVPGTPPANVLILGSGTVGMGAFEIATGLGANVTITTRNPDKLKHLESDKVKVIETKKEAIAEAIKDADIVVGGILIAGGKAPKVVTEEMVKTMKKGSFIADVSIDQGGCVETSRPTSHSDPVFEKHGVIHYCVTNMPGAFPRTSTLALTKATLPYALKLAKGLGEAVKDKGLAKGINTYKGFITYKPVAEDLDMLDKYKDLNELL
ncbi:alanine dehydrogenase [Candidatus Woesearchaeota archaeon]|nr:alanine dehydrogenase [Candidatus Woesearchaeota archaeon]